MKVGFVSEQDGEEFGDVGKSEQRQKESYELEE